MASFHPHPLEDSVNCERFPLWMFCNLTPEAPRDYDGNGIMMSHARGVMWLLKQFRRDQWIKIKGFSLAITKPDQLEGLTALIALRPRPPGGHLLHRLSVIAE
jgi:hypothetical protein